MGQKKDTPKIHNSIFSEGYSGEDTFKSQEIATPRFSITTGQMFCHYLIQEELGRGGMGIVYKALDTKLNREVALKLILAVNSPKKIQRFMREATAIAQLQHPNIIKLFEINDSPINYFTMEYVKGSTLSFLIKNKKIPPTVLASVLQKVADALHDAHKNEIIHRDIKPANIMVTDNNIPKLMDFGLAKIVNVDSRLSKTGEILGTPVYMSPEQADNKKVDKCSDIYSMGATLYEALTGRPPFEGNSFFNILTRLITEDPIPPRSLNPDIPCDLEAICLKCLSKSPSKRYSTAKQLAKDFENFIAHRPILAKPPTKWTYVKKFIYRNLPLVLITTLIFFTLCVGGIFSFVQWQKAQNAQRELQKKERLTQIVNQNLEIEKNNILQIKQEKEQEANIANTRLAMIAYEKAIESYENKEWDKCGVLAGAAIDFVKNLHDKNSVEIRTKARSLIKISFFHYGLLWETAANRFSTQVAFRSDGQVLAIASLGKVELHAANNGKKIQEIHIEEKLPTTLSFSPNGQEIVIAGQNIHICNAVTGKRLAKLDGDGNTITALNFSSNGKILASSSRGKTITLWNLSNNKKMTTWRFADETTSLSFSPDGKTLAFISEDKAINLWNVASGTEIWKRFRTTKINDLSFHPHGKSLVSACGQEITIWNVKTGQEVKTFYGHNSRITSVAFSPDGKTIASASEDRTVKLWDVVSLKKLSVFNRYTSTINSVAFSPNGKTLAVVSNQLVHLWNTNRQALFYEYKGYASDICFSPKEKVFATSGHSNVIKLRNVGSEKPFALLSGHQHSVTSMCFSKDVNTLASSSNNNIRLWDIATAKLITIRTTASKIRTMVFSPDGKTLIFAGEDKKIRVWDLEKNKVTFTLEGHGEAINSLSFSPDGKILASAGVTTIFWEIPTYRRRILKEAQLDVIKTISFRHDGKILATAGHSRNIKLWDVATGSLLKKITYEKAKFKYVCFSPDGETIASALNDNSIVLWDIANKVMIEEFSEPLGNVKKLGFSTSGNILFSASDWSVKFRHVPQINLFPIKVKQILNATLKSNGNPQNFSQQTVDKILEKQVKQFTEAIFHLHISSSLKVIPRR